MYLFAYQSLYLNEYVHVNTSIDIDVLTISRKCPYTPFKYVESALSAEKENTENRLSHAK